jgi:hypothetical protein
VGILVVLGLGAFCGVRLLVAGVVRLVHIMF